jgi:hypothetical protein
MRGNMPKRYKHSLTHFRHTTCDLGQMIPILNTEMIHGSTLKHHTSLLLRTSPLKYPLMHPVHAFVTHFAVPIRKIYDDFEDFLTGGEDLDDASVLPTITFDGTGDNPDPVTAGSLANHLGLPVGFNGTVLAFYFRAYAMIYNELIRDDQLQDEVGLSTAGGPDTTTNTDLLYANWGKDYFQRARVDEQLGADVTIELTGNAPVTTDAAVDADVSVQYESGSGVYRKLAANTSFVERNANAGLLADRLYADMGSVGAIELNDLRLAIATQNFREYVNWMGNNGFKDYLPRYGINYADGRLDQPEFLGASRKTIQFSEVIATAEGTNTEVGDLKGHGIAALRGNNYMRFFEEPMIVMSFLTVKPIPMYMQSVHRSFYRSTKEDFYQKEYEIIPTQEILNKELKHDHATPDGVLGYVSKFQEYREIPNTVHGEFSDPNSPLRDYHMAMYFGSDPALNSTLRTCVPPESAFADTNEAHIKATVQHHMVCRNFVRKRAPVSTLLTI